MSSERAAARLDRFEREVNEDGDRIVTPAMVAFARNLLHDLHALGVPAPDDLCPAPAFGSSAFAVDWWQAGREGEPRRTALKYTLTIYLDADGKVHHVSPSHLCRRVEQYAQYPSLARWMVSLYETATDK